MSQRKNYGKVPFTFCHKLELLLTNNIIPMILIAWKVSFAEVIENKETFAERGLNPLNHNLLLLDILRRAMTQRKPNSTFLLLKNAISI